MSVFCEFLQDPYRLKGAGVKGTTKSSETGSCSETAKDGEKQENKREQQDKIHRYKIIKRRKEDNARIS